MDRATTYIFLALLLGIVSIIGCTAQEETVMEETIVPEAQKYEGEVFNVAVQPCWSPTDSFTMFTPIVEYLKKETGLNLKLIIVENEEDFHEKMRAFSFTLQDAYSVFVHNRNSVAFDPLAIAVSKKGEATEQGAIITRADSGLRAVSDLKGKTFLFGAPHNTPKFMGAYITLKKNGLDPAVDLKGYEFGGDCDDNAMSVFLGEYTAGAVCKDFIDSKNGKRRFNFKTDLLVIADTAPLPNWMFAASRNVDKTVVSNVKAALLKLKPKASLSNKFLEKTEWIGFADITGQEIELIDNLANKYSLPIL